MKPEPLKNKHKELIEKITDYLKLHRSNYPENINKFILDFATFIIKEREKQEKSAVEWLNRVVKKSSYWKVEREKGIEMKVISLDTLFQIVDEAFPDLEVEK